MILPAAAAALAGGAFLGALFAYLPRLQARLRGMRVPALPAYAARELDPECDPTEKEHVQAFRRTVLKKFGGRDAGIVRACNIGKSSQHHRGTAWDWGLPLKGGKFDKPTADRFLRWLLASDAKGRPHARARRAGVMYMIYNRRMWRSYGPNAFKWMPIPATSNPHTDHIHLSFSRRRPQ